MADNKSGADLLGDWQALQQQYWSSMGEMARQLGEQSQAAGTPGMPSWHEGLEIWSRAFQGGGTGQGQLIERALEHGKAYLDMLQRMGGMASQPVGKAGLQDWSAAFSDLMKGSMPGTGASGFDALQSATMQGSRGIEQMMADMQPVLSLFLGEARSLLGVQPFGMAREHQERQQALAAAMLDYQQASARHQGLLGKALQRGIEVFEGKLSERSEPGRHIDSPKALYDLWIDCAEEGYAEVALSEAFQDAYGALVNTQMRVRQLLQQQIERLCTSLGMPTRTEVNSVNRKLVALKGDSSALRELTAEVARLRARVDGETGTKARSSSRSTKVKPAAAKRAASIRKQAKPVRKSAAGASAKQAARSGKAASPPTVAKRASAARKRKTQR